MSLPGEIRNQVYTHYFAPSFRCEFAAEGFQFHSPQSRTVKLWSGLVHSEHKPYKYETQEAPQQPTTIRISRPLGQYNIVKGLNTNWASSIYALNLVCKQIYGETNAYLYNKTVFAFNAPKRINAFLSLVPQTNLTLITKLQLHYTTYGEPVNSCDCIWKAKHLSSWSRACRSAAKKLLNLKTLEVDIHHPNHAPKFNLREPWLLPILQFRRLSRKSKASVENTQPSSLALTHLEAQANKTLTNVRVRISTTCSDSFGGNDALTRASRHLHELFGQAVELAIRGAGEEEAMEGFMEAWEGRYAVWKHHLQFARTGW